MSRNGEGGAMARSASVRLIVQADDFGMCHAVNEGVVEAYLNGILTQATMMAPCPWFAEAAALAKRHGIPVGMHSTLTCEWNTMRWRPLTRGASLAAADGGFHATVAAASRAVVPSEASAELEAQARAMVDRDLSPIYFDTHMGLVSREAYAHICELYERPFLLPFVPRFLKIDSMLVLSPRPADRKKADLLQYLVGLAPGDHFIQSHPAVASEELRALASPGSDIEPWAETYRVSDLAVLTDPEVIAFVDASKIELITVSDLGDHREIARLDVADPAGSARAAQRPWGEVQ